MTFARICRWTAIVLAALAIVDPPVPFPRPERPPVRVAAAGDEAGRQRVADRLRRDGFPIASDGESAVIVTAGAEVTPSLPSPPIYVVRPDGPEIAIVHVAGSGTRVEGQAVVVSATIRARRARRTETTIRLEDGGLTVATATRRWEADEETWHAALTYLPHGPGAMRLRVRAGADSAADLLVPAARGPLRTLVLESGVTWPAVFVRRCE